MKEKPVDLSPVLGNQEPGTFTQWRQEARRTVATLAAHRQRQTELANLLRQRWDDWKAEAGYATWDECLKAELGLSKQALHDRNYRARKKKNSIECARDRECTDTESATDQGETVNDAESAEKPKKGKKPAKKARQPVDDGQRRCDCGRLVPVNKNGTLRKHDCRTERIEHPDQLPWKHQVVISQMQEIGFGLRRATEASRKVNLKHLAELAERHHEWESGFTFDLNIIREFIDSNMKGEQ